MSIWGHPPVTSFTPKTFEVDGSLDYDDFLSYNYALITAGSVDVAIPDPEAGLLDCCMVLGNSGNAASTFSNTGGFLTGDSISLDAGAHVLLVCAQTAASTYKWVTIGVAPTYSGLAEYISDTVGAMFSGNTETGIAATYQDADNTVDLVVAYGTDAATACVGNDVRLPVAPTSYTPSCTWDGSAPSGTNTFVGRFWKNGPKQVRFTIDLYGTDGDGRKLQTVSLPTGANAPADVDMYIPVSCHAIIDEGGTPSYPTIGGFVDAKSGTPILNITTSPTCTDAKIFHISLTGEYETA